MPDKSKKILDHIKIADEDRFFKSINKMYEGGIKITKPKPIFPRIL
jgi:hypothetical protein